ncbi:BnaC04g19920D [Brassica napus]|uniref:BnaC04g19920D protein n=1 Tax=Brassica napus TaxID=3708 RepID=A0A078HAG8_BRANA|nr:BnaC04g19920D [Brassica napus]
MKLIWSPETASKAYIDTVKSCEKLGTPGAAELVAAMAAGWNATLIVETWSEGETIDISVGLNVASQHTNARHICIVPNAISEAAYLQAMTQQSCSTLPETIIMNEEEEGNSENTMQMLQGIDFLVIDWDQKDFAANVLRNAAFGSRGAVVVCRSGYRRSTSCFSWTKAFSDRNVVRTVTLPVSGGLEIAHVAAARSSGKNDNNNKRKWIKHIDQRSGEEHVIRK